jgi:hypothetical protein
MVVWGVELQALVVQGAIRRTSGSLWGFFVFNPKCKRSMSLFGKGEKFLSPLFHFFSKTIDLKKF